MVNKKRIIYFTILILNSLFWYYFDDYYLNRDEIIDIEIDNNNNNKNKLEEKHKIIRKKINKQNIDPYCKNFSKKKCFNSSKVIPTFRVFTEHICFQSEPLIFIYVFSEAKSFEKRKTIRKTWGSTKQFPSIQIAFILGISKDDLVNNKIIKENRQFKDIIQGNFLVRNNNYF